ncbi:MAG: RHS repeat protein, partial [Burkholderiales bacterium]
MGPGRVSGWIGALLLGLALASAAPVGWTAAACVAAGGDPGLGACPGTNGPAAAPAPAPFTGAGNPIDLGTGNKHQREVDFGGGGDGSELPLVRSYNSRLVGRIGAFGPGWQHGYEAVLWQRSRDEIQLLQADGRRLRFARRDGDRTRLHTEDPADGHLDLDAAWAVWTWPDGRRLRFALGTGRLASIDYGDGRRVELRRAAGRLTSLHGPAGTVLRFGYGRSGQVVAAVQDEGDGRARRLHYAYDGLGNLAAVRDDGGLTRRYRYEDPLHPHHLTAVEHQRVPYRPVTVGSWRYDARGRAVGYAGGGTGLTVTYGPPAANGSGHAWVSVRDASGRGGRYRFARFGDRARLVEASGEGCPSCPAAPARYRYDAGGRLVSAAIGARRLEIERDPGGAVTAVRVDATRYALDADGRLAGWSVPGAGKVQVRHARRGLLEASAPGTGNALRVLRDARGRVTERVAGAPGRARLATRWRYRGSTLAAVEHPHASVALERSA